MAEFKLSYTASEINEKLGKVATPDWNASEGEVGYVKNRTHYEETTVVNEPLSITWDGNTEGLVGVMDVFFKVSDLVLTDEQIKTATVTGSNGLSAYIGDMWEMMVSEGRVTEDWVLLSEDIVVVVRKDNLDVGGLTFPQKGIYFLSYNDLYISSLTTTEPVEQTKTVVHKLDKKFLPDNVDIFKVNISYDAANSKWVSDKTYDEIIAAEEARIPITGTFTNTTGKVFTLLGCDAAEYPYCALSAFDVGKTHAPIIYKIQVHSSSEVGVYTLTLTAEVERYPVMQN